MENTKKDNLSIISAILFLILGIILILYPNDVVKFITYILGAILVILGLAKLLFYKKNKEAVNNTNNLSIGIVLIVIGIITMFLSGVIEFVVRLVIGAWLLYSGILKLILALKVKELGIKTWYIPLISSGIMLICGLYTIIAENMLNMAGGIVLVIYSIAEIVQYIAIPKSKNESLIVK